MKFLIINRGTGGDDHGVDVSPASLDTHADTLRGLLSNGTLEGAWALLSGGHAYVTTAADAEDLALKLRGNPLFKSSHTEVLPIADAVDFIDRYAGMTSK